LDLPPPAPVVVTEHQILKRWCPHCARWRTPHIDWQAAGIALGHGRLGQRLVALLAYLRTVARLPVRTIQEYLQTLHGLHLSVGAITGVLDRLAPRRSGAREGTIPIYTGLSPVPETLASCRHTKPRRRYAPSPSRPGSLQMSCGILRDHPGSRRQRAVQVVSRSHTERWARRSYWQ